MEEKELIEESFLTDSFYDYWNLLRVDTHILVSAYYYTIQSIETCIEFSKYKLELYTIGKITKVIYERDSALVYNKLTTYSERLMKINKVLATRDFK